MSWLGCIFIFFRNVRDLVCDYDGFLVKMDYLRFVELWFENIS